MSGGYEEDGHPDELKAMFEERLNRPMTGPTAADFGEGADGSLRRSRDFHFELDVEMVVFGSTQPHARLNIGGEPATVRSDGTFSARVPMPNTRQVIPVTSRARDGSDEQTIVIAVERNTKVMEPVSSNNTEPKTSTFRQSSKQAWSPTANCLSLCSFKLHKLSQISWPQQSRILW